MIGGCSRPCGSAKKLVLRLISSQSLDWDVPHRDDDLPTVLNSHSRWPPYDTGQYLGYSS